MTGEQEGRYVYGILDCNRDLIIEKKAIGGNGNRVSCCTVRDISALVSESPVTKYPISRENLMLHQKILEEAMEHHTVLPVRFCTIAENEEQVKKIIAKRYDEFRDLMIKMKDVTELGVKALWSNISLVYQNIVEEHPAIKKLKQILERGNHTKGKEYSLKIQLGEMVKLALERKKEKEAEMLVKELKPLARSLKENPTHGDIMFLNAALLVEKEKETVIDHAVDRLIGDQERNIRIKYIGPVPIYNFVDIVIHWE
ncbi:MAG: GvpL/GvpF family gas vesicle protein [Vulcanimicrobiota bacterium]